MFLTFLMLSIEMHQKKLPKAFVEILSFQKYTRKVPVKNNFDINDPAFDFSHADLSNDGKLTVLDATLIQIDIAKGEAPVVPTDPTEEPTTEPSEETTEPTEPATEETTEDTEPTTDPTEETTDDDYELPFVPAD